MVFESWFGVVQKLIISDFPLLWGPAVALNEKKPKVFDWFQNFFTPKKHDFFFLLCGRGGGGGGVVVVVWGVGVGGGVVVKGEGLHQLGILWAVMEDLAWEGRLNQLGILWPASQRLCLGGQP